MRGVTRRRNLSGLGAAAALVAVLVSAGCVPQRPLEVGGPMDLQLRTLDGEPFSFAEMRGHVMLVDVWASWCGPCRESLPFYADLANAWKDRGFRFVGINVDEDVRAARAFLRREKLSLFTIRDPGAEAVAARLPVTRLPTAFLVDRSGRIRYTHEGFVSRDKQLLRDALDKLLDEPVPTAD